MDVAQGVLGLGVAAVGLKAVVDGDPGEVGQHAGVVEAVEAALVVQRVERRLVGARAEQPPQPALGAGAGLVEERDRRRGDLGVNLSLIHISEPTRRTPISYAVFCLKKKNK